MLRRLIPLLAAALLLTGCGLRIDSAPPTPDTPSATEMARQRAAIALQALADGDAATFGPVAESAAHAKERADLLGGVWQACPQGATETACAALPSAPAIPRVASEADAQVQAREAVAALRELAACDSPGGIVASGILPALHAELPADVTAPSESESSGAALPAWGEGKWTTSPEVIGALDWGAWQIEALAARTEDNAKLRELVRRYRAAAHAPAVSGAADVRPPATHITEQLSLPEILERTAHRVAAELPRLPVAERLAALSYLIETSQQLRTAGGTLPASWLAN
ncbi:hypothetical protein [Bowdeniella nasicola]|nr:hypothetical protein [Bowdeniella nasicola]